MYKLTLIVALAIVTMAFTLPQKGQGKDQGKSGHSEKGAKMNTSSPGKDSPKSNPTFSQSQHGNKGDKGGSKNNGGSHDKGSKGDHGNVKQQNPFGSKASNGHDKGGNHDKGVGKSHKNDQSFDGKHDKGNQDGGKHKDVKHYDGKHDQGKNGHKKHANGMYAKAYKGKGGKMHYEKGHPNFGYVFVSTHGYYSHKNFGQWRSKEAKKKHKHYHPYYEYEAIEGFNLIILRNNFLFTEADYKINLINVQLAKKRKSNAITLVQYNTYTRRIAVLEKRRASLQLNIVL